MAGRGIGRILVAAFVERLYFLIPGLAAVCCVWAALTQVHGGNQTFAMAAVFVAVGNIGVAAFILIFGAPGIFRTWRRWNWGLAVTVVLAVAAFGALVLQLRATSP